MDLTLYRSFIGSLRYLLHMKLDSTYSISILSRYMVNPTSYHWTTAKKVLRCLKGTIKFGLIYEKGDNRKKYTLNHPFYLHFDH